MTASTAATEEYIYYLLTILKHNGKGALINKHAFIIICLINMVLIITQLYDKSKATRSYVSSKKMCNRIKILNFFGIES